MIGAYGQSGSSGLAHLYDIDDSSPNFGNLLATYANPDPHADDAFGFPVVLQGDTAIVGASRQIVDGVADVGQVYRFILNPNGIPASVQVLPSPNPTVANRFSFGIEPYGPQVLIGATRATEQGQQGAGMAHLLSLYDGAELPPPFINPTPAYEEFFGTSIAASGSIAAIGGSEGDLHIFRVVTGEEVQAVIRNPVTPGYSEFGVGLDLRGGVLAVGDPADDVTGQGIIDGAGRVYIYRNQQSVDIAVKSTYTGGKIHPHHSDFLVKPFKNDVVPVVVYGASKAAGDPSDFDVLEINPMSVRLGPARGQIAPDSAPELGVDYDDDGQPDARFEFLMGDSGIACEDTDVLLGGETDAGNVFEGVGFVDTDCNAQCHPD